MKRRACVLLSIAVLITMPVGIDLPCLASASGLSELPSVTAPYGSFIPDILLDGIVGIEWEDASEYEVVMGNYNARLLVKHDHVYFYVAMEIDTRMYFTAGFEAYVVFENGDGVDYSRGDDMMSVPEWDGELLEADLTYRASYSFLMDADYGGTNDAVGAGRYDTEADRYVFEFRREMLSGDSCDVPLHEGENADLIYGWASY